MRANLLAMATSRSSRLHLNSKNSDAILKLMRKGKQLAMAAAVILAVLVLLLHPATPGVKAPVESKQLKEIQIILMAVFAAVLFFARAVDPRHLIAFYRSVGSERSPERISFCSLLC
jgi:hypothetical protein